MQCSVVRLCVERHSKWTEFRLHRPNNTEDLPRGQLRLPGRDSPAFTYGDLRPCALSSEGLRPKQTPLARYHSQAVMRGVLAGRPERYPATCLAY